MTDRSVIQIALTREQQLEVLAATGLLVKTMEMHVDDLDEGGAALASLPLPKWLMKETTAG